MYNRSEEENLKDQKIILNPQKINTDIESGNQSSDLNNPNKKSSGGFMDFFTNPKDAIAKQMMDTASDRSTGWFDKFKCNFEFLQVYFDVDTDEIKNRLINSLIPFNSKFHEIIDNKPDLYGPLWIYTTLIFVIAASGSLSMYLSQASNEEFFQQFVPMAASIIYGIGFILPLVLTVLMKCFGSETKFLSVLCIYAYSFTVYIPTVVSFQWILIGAAVASSTSFLLVNFWKELSKYVENRRYFILGVILVCQVSLFLLLKLYFFGRRKV